MFKVLQLASQDAAARRLEKRYQPDVVVSEGNLVLSVVGRAANYLRPSRLGEDPQSWKGDPSSLERAFAVLGGNSIAGGWIGFLSKLGGFLKFFGFHTLWLPDVVVLLDLTSEQALERIRSRGAQLDPHENKRDLEQARFMYTRTLEALTSCRGSKVVSVPVGATPPRHVLQAVTTMVRQHVNESDRR